MFKICNTNQTQIFLLQKQPFKLKGKHLGCVTRLTTIWSNFAISGFFDFQIIDCFEITFVYFLSHTDYQKVHLQCNKEYIYNNCFNHFHITDIIPGIMQYAIKLLD